jgi:hypothetical protein
MWLLGLLFFSSHELKAQVSYSDHLLSVACPSVRLSVNFYIFDFFSRTTGSISTRLAEINLGWREFKFVQTKEIALPQWEIIAKE